jgi:hypothetical protein
MSRRVGVLAVSILVFSPLNVVQAQNVATPANHTDLKTLIVAAGTGPGSTIVVPPATSETVILRGRNHSAPLDINLGSWLSKEAALNGLESTDIHPWHILVTYDQFDEDGDNVHSGTYEEFWAGPKEYKQIYKSDNFNQTDYATDRGLFRSGDQRWPDPAELQVWAEVIAPFSYAATLQGFHGRSMERTFSGYNLQCVLIEKDSVRLSDPTQYCFEPDGSTLRYSHGFGWFQTAYNWIVSFQGRNVAQDVDVTDGGKPYLQLYVKTIEIISDVNKADFTPPPGAVGPVSGRISDVHPTLIKMSFPEWPASLRGEHFSIEVELVIGTNGHVISAHAVSGPPKGRKACEDAVRKSVFATYLVLDKPVEVETKFVCDRQ